jgi:predicted kinase
MKKLGVLISSPKPKKIRKSVSEWAEEIKKAGPHKYVKREGTPGNYTYYYRLPDGSIGSKEELDAATRRKNPVDQKGKRSPNFYEPGKPKRGQAAAARRKIPANAPKLGIRINGIDVKGNKVSGEVTNQGADGVTIDHKNHIAYGNVASAEGGGQDNTKTAATKEWIDPENFNAAEWSKQWIDPRATPDDASVEYILGDFGEEGTEIAQKIVETNAKVKNLPDTSKQYCLHGKGESARYTPEREKLHERIMQKILSPDKVRVARPDDGQAPAMMILGGRGGSGKSWFKNNVYDPNKYIILDADAIKNDLPEFKNWNAQEVHEESSDILEQMLNLCIREGLNVVLDVTMKTYESALAKVLRFKSAGYRTEAHYMHLPVQEAAKRAVFRYKDDGERSPNGEAPQPYSGRYVPINIVLGNKTNEDSFDQVRKIVDKWSFRDNDVKRGEQPILISAGEKAVKKSFAALVKKICQMYN